MFSRFKMWGITSLFLLISVPQVAAQGSWADALVDTRKLEFGVIATGSEAVKVVTIENTTRSTVHISSVSTGCRCAEVGQPGKNLLQPGEKTTLEVRMNTRSFRQQRDTSLSIYFDAPQFAEVRIPISAYIRTDVVFDPGKVDLGRVEYLAGGQQTLRIAYAGRPDWKIMDVKLPTDVSARLRETMRAGGNVTYELEVKLDATSRPGRIRDLITLVTDDATNPHVPLIFEATVVPDIKISNPNIALRTLRPGDTAVVPVVVEGTRPFTIEAISGSEMNDCFDVRLSDKDEKVHVVKMNFTAPDRSGQFREEMIVRVKGREEPLKFYVSGAVSGPVAPK